MKTLFLTNGMVSLVDDDLIYLQKYNFRLQKTRNGKPFYARCSIKGKEVLLHKIIMPEKNKIVDHINGDGLDNRRSNLRYVTHSENSQNKSKQKNNTSGYRGIWYRKDRGTFVAEFRCEKKTLLKKSFKSLPKAIDAWNEVAFKNGVPIEHLNKHKAEL